MKEIGMSYNDLENMPMEYLEWFYDRELQHKIDLEEKKKSQ
jgi:hypothetical protein